MSLAAEIAAGLRRDPTRPLLTWYDDATGERVELSAATTSNWVSKVANLLRDGLDLQPGDHVAVALPLHWQTVVIHLATWSAGGCVVSVEPGSAVPRAPVAFVTERELGGLAAAGLGRGVEVVALSLRPMAGRLTAAPPGVLDFAVEVPGYGDDFAAGPPAYGPAAVVGGDEVGVEDLLAAAASAALLPGERVLVRHPPWTLDGLAMPGLAPLLAGAGAVLCGPAGADVPAARLAAEQVTRTLG